MSVEYVGDTQRCEHCKAVLYEGNMYKTLKDNEGLKSLYVDPKREINMREHVCPDGLSCERGNFNSALGHYPMSKIIRIDGIDNWKSDENVVRVIDSVAVASAAILSNMDRDLEVPVDGDHVSAFVKVADNIVGVGVKMYAHKKKRLL